MKRMIVEFDDQQFEAVLFEDRAPIICGNIARQPAMKLYPHRTVGDLAHANAVMDRSFSFGIHQDVGAARLGRYLHHCRAFRSRRCNHRRESGSRRCIR